MATLTITEFANIPFGPGGNVQNNMPVGMFDTNAVFQTPITISTSAVSSSAFGANTRFIRVNTAAAVNFLIGPPTLTTASSTSARMSADRTEYFGVAPGQIFSCISAS